MWLTLRFARSLCVWEQSRAPASQFGKQSARGCHNFADLPVFECHGIELQTETCMAMGTAETLPVAGQIEHNIA